MRVLLWLPLLVGCVKNTQVEQAAQPTPVALATVLESTESAGLQPIPEAVDDRFSEELSRRNLVPSVLDSTEGLQGVGTTEARVAWLAESVDGARAVLLVETEARFSTQVNGRYRWNITGNISLVPQGPEQPLSSELSIPIALVYDHQGEEDALAEAAPLVARRVGALLDAWLSEDAPR